MKGNKPRKNTFRHLVESIRTSLSREGFPSSHTRFSAYQIYDKLLSSRASYITRTKIARQGIGNQCIQTIPCIPLEKADVNVCPCNPPKGCTWLKSKLTVPKIISLISVTNSAADFSAEYVEWGQFRNKLNSRNFNKKKRYYTFLDTGDGSHLYLYNDKGIKNVAINGIVEDPNAAATYEGCGKLSKEQKHLLCNPLDTPIYMDGQIADVVCKMTFDYFAKTTPVSQPDIDNDNLDNAGGLINPNR